MSPKKYIAKVLVATLLLGLLPQGIFGNSQNPIKKIKTVEVGHVTDTTPGQDNIFPNVTIEWEKPEANVIPSEKGINDVSEPTYYDFTLTNMSNASVGSGKKVDVSAQEFDVPMVKLEDYFRNVMRNGTLYEAQIIARHKHQTVVNGETVYSNAPGSPTPIPSAYFITDFNIQATISPTFQFTWEYIPGVHYQLVYVEGDKKDKAEIDAATKKTIVPITPQKAAASLNETRDRVVYQPKDVKAGTIYTAYVIPTGIEGKKVSIDQVVYNKTTPKVAKATPNIQLNLDNIGQNKIRLWWNINEAGWVVVGNNLVKTIIHQVDAMGQDIIIGTIENGNMGNNDVGYFEYTAPKESVTYYVEFVFKNDIPSFIAGPIDYVPEELKEVPLQPRVPNEFDIRDGSSLTNDIISNQNKYKVKYNGLYDDIGLTINSLNEFRKHTFHSYMSNNEPEIQLVWDAIKNQSTGEVDYDLYYDIWVTDNRDTLNTAQPIISNLRVMPKQDANIIYRQDGETVVGFKTDSSNSKINLYTTSHNEVKALSTNRTYYIKMVAKRKYGKTYTVSTPTILSISIAKDGDVYDPPVLGKPPLQLGEITATTAEIQWVEEWYELMAKDADSLYPSVTHQVENLLARYGHSSIYLDQNQKPAIRYIDPSISNPNFGAQTPLKLYGKLAQDNLAKIRKSLETSDYPEGYYANNYVEKFVSIGSDVNYEIKVMTQKDVEALRGDEPLELWLKNNEKNLSEGWSSITDALTEVTIDGVQGKRYLVAKDYQNQALKPNTSYVIMIRTSRMVEGEIKYSAFPSYILCTTLTDHTSKPEVPKTPTLYLYKDRDITATDISVRWIYNDSFDYELRYSRLDDPEKAEKWTFTDEEMKTFSDGAEAKATITGLVPETTYNFWIRAIQKKTNSDGEILSSDWSNPVIATTLALDKPLPPSGLGPAAYQSILEAGQDFPPISKDYITVEWMRIASDKDNAEIENGSSNLSVQYQYVVEFANNPEFLDSIVVNTSEPAIEGTQIVAKNIIRFDNLESNKPYYVKVKTVLKYINPDTGKVVIKESDFSNWVRILTKTSNDEYDGGENDNIIIYPEAIVDTYTNGIWTKEIVDTAKIISQIQNSKHYFLTVTMENYKNKYDADVRRLKMPKNVVDTLINRGMALKVITNVGIYEIPGKALRVYSNQYSARDIVQFDFTKATLLNIAAIGRSYPESFIKGERFEVMFRGSTKNTAVQKLDDHMKIKLKLELVGQYNFANMNTYTYSYYTNSWSKQNPAIETQTDSYFVYSTPYTGLHALYQRLTIASNTGSTYIMNELKAAYDIRGLGDIYFKQDYVYGNQYIQLLMGIAQNKSSIDLTESVTSDLKTKARTSGIYISQSTGTVTKEQALAGVVKLYELKQGYQVKPSKVVFKGVSSTYKEAVGKAYALGLIDEAINPSGKVTYSELCDWIIQVIE